MAEILYGWPGLVLIIVIATAAGLYIPWLEEHYHCTAFMLDFLRQSRASGSQQNRS